jgi:hypothetical protein
MNRKQWKKSRQSVNEGTIPKSAWGLENHEKPQSRYMGSQPRFKTRELQTRNQKPYHFRHLTQLTDWRHKDRTMKYFPIYYCSEQIDMCWERIHKMQKMQIWWPHQTNLLQEQ